MRTYFFAKNGTLTEWSGLYKLYESAVRERLRKGEVEINYEEYKILLVVREFGIRKTMEIIEKYYGEVL